MTLKEKCDPESKPRPVQELNGGELFEQLDSKARRKFIDRFFAFANANISLAQHDALFGGVIDHLVLGNVMRWICQNSSYEDVSQFIALMYERSAETSAFVKKFRRESFAKAGHMFVDVGSDESELQRLGVQLGGADKLIQFKRLLVLYANAKLLSKLTEFADTESEHVFECHFAGICNELETIPAHVHALMMFQIARKCLSPRVFINGLVQAAGTSNPAAIAAKGLDLPLKALLVHAEELVEGVQRMNSGFFDADDVCAKIERFHNISQALIVGIDLDDKDEFIRQLQTQARRLSRWIEPIIKNTSYLIIRALKLPKNKGHYVMNKEAILEAKSGMYVLEAVRRCRDSLAVNVLFAKTWKEVGAILEPIMQQSLSHFTDHPVKNSPAHLRLDASIELGKLRFGDEYSQIYLQARDMAFATQEKPA